MNTVDELIIFKMSIIRKHFLLYATLGKQRRFQAIVTAGDTPRMSLI